jgi:hypothetical protein
MTLFQKLAVKVYPPLRRLAFFVHVWRLRMDSLHRVATMKTRPSDIFVVSYPKSGTTWMQMLLFQLTTDGDLDSIPHLLVYSPHVDEGGKLVEDPSVRRIIKTHAPHKAWPKDVQGKHIVVLRNGLDVAQSYFHHYRNYLNFQGPFEAFFRLFVAGKVMYGSWFDFLAGWMKERDNPNFLFVRFEDMKADFEGVVRKVADFLDIEVSDEAMARIRERCSLEYMREHEEKLALGSQAVAQWRQHQGKFFRRGEVGEGKTVPAPLLARYRQKFAATVGRLGLDEDLAGD